MIDRSKPLEVCKIEACNYVRHKVEQDGLSINRALQDISDEAGIPFGTLKNWFYPAKMERNAEHQREVREQAKVGVTSPQQPTDEELDDLYNKVEGNLVKQAKEITREKFAVKKAERVKVQKEIMAQKLDEFDKPILYKDTAMSPYDGEPYDLMITDPPFMTDVDDINSFARSWLPGALVGMKPTGRAYVCVGAYPEELNAYLNVANSISSITLANVLVWTYRNTIGPSPKMDYKLNWQAILYFRGPEAPPLNCPVMIEQFSVQDINAPDGRVGERYHAWEKPMELGERFVRHSTESGDLVYDPFAGTGTFLLAAASLGRRAIGKDIDDNMIKIAIERGCNYAK